ncbi:hypothetical protein [uncultured Algimonas sp.]|uniref:hypothetical protein n=1 Tax=uncultured Algimonas sp. TaxID=1547920 RepID=UPI002621AA04|nr:hypothetical protein [uncultured Algimonas sp.]
MSLSPTIHKGFIGIVAAGLVTGACAASDISPKVLSTPAAVAEYLKSSEVSPFDCLDEEARYFFVNSLVFGDRGLTSYAYIYLSDLNPEERQALLGLFDAEADPARPHCPVRENDLSPPSELAARLVSLQKTEAGDFDETSQDRVRARLDSHLPREQWEALLGAAGPWAIRTLMLEAGQAGYGPETLEGLFRRLESREQARPEDARRLHRAYIDRRDLAAAERFSQARPHYELITPSWPERVDLKPGERRVLTLARDGTLRERAVDLTDYGLLVLSSPSCGFCHRARAAITRDDALFAAMSRSSLWVSPPSELPSDAPQRRWSDEEPELAHHIAYAREDWPEVELWATPTFLFLEDGKVVGRLTGWPEDEAMSRLAALRGHLLD